MVLATLFSLSFPGADLTLKVVNPGITVQPGIHLPCYGPFVPPAGSRALRRLQPQVNMEIVHHMIMFGGRGPPPSTRIGPTHACYQGSIMYAWARTGQTTPIGLNFEDTQLEGDGFAVGAGTQFEWMAIQIHYQQLGTRAVVDHSGVDLSFARVPPVRPLEVQLMASWRLRIPPRVKMDECVACRVVVGGVVVAWRNHAHRLARDIYSEHFSRNGAPQPSLGNISSQKPQIFRVLPQSRSLEAGDTLLLHCQYDATAIDRVTYLGVDERTHEMCNQYLMATSGLRLNCQADRTVPDAAFNSKFGATHATLSAGSNKAGQNWLGLRGAPSAHGASPVEARAAAGLAGVGVGEVCGIAIDERTQTLYVLHRAANRFDSRLEIAGPAVLALEYDGSLKGALAPNTFVVPHGLSVDALSGMLWATDVHRHQCLKIDPTANGGAGAVVLALGERGKAGSGPAHFNAPTDVAVHPHTGRVYVSDGYGNARVAVFSADGVFVAQWGSAGSGEGQFRVPHSITIDRRGDVYVADRENARVQVFDAAGAFKAQWASRVATSLSRYSYSKHVSSVEYHPSLDLIAVSEGDAVVIRTPSGCTLLESEANLKWPHDAVLIPTASLSGRPAPNRSAVAHDGAQYSLFVAELSGKRVKRFNSAGIAAGDNGGGVSLYG